MHWYAIKPNQQLTCAGTSIQDRSRSNEGVTQYSIELQNWSLVTRISHFWRVHSKVVIFSALLGIKKKFTFHLFIIICLRIVIWYQISLSNIALSAGVTEYTNWFSAEGKPLLTSGPVSWGCRTYRLLLSRGLNLPPTSVLYMTLKNLMVRFQ